jgi:hypothetical protein
MSEKHEIIFVIYIKFTSIFIKNEKMSRKYLEIPMESK